MMQPRRRFLPDAPASPNVRRGVRILLWALVLLVPVLAAGWVMTARTHEDGILLRARRQLERGEWGAASQTLAALRTGPLLSGDGRRRAAELHFRLGEDEKAHTLLVGQRYDNDDASDRRLRQLSARCQRVATLLKRADASRKPDERVRLLRAARQEVPESPHLLQRLTREELLAMLATDKQEYEQGFEQSYAALRTHAPRLASELKASIARMQAEAGPATPGNGGGTGPLRQH